MTDYISRDEIFSVWRSMPKPASISSLVDAINRTPAADVEPVRHGRWIPCSERLPEDGQDVLCWYQYFRYGNYNRLWKTYGIGFQYNGNWGGEVANGTKARVLAWMPLPEPPAEGGNENAAD